MNELQALLKSMKNDGAPAFLIEKLEKLITERALRIQRHADEDFRKFIEMRTKKEANDKIKEEDNHFLMMLLLLLLMGEANGDKDEFGLSDAFPNWKQMKRTFTPDFK